MQVSVYIATSLDGFIAREDGSLDWLPGANGEPVGEEGQDYGYAAFMAEVDAMAMGRKTYETVAEFGQWFYGATPVYVLSRTWEALPGKPLGQERLWKQSPIELVEQLKAQGCRRLYVDGGQCIQEFLRLGLVTDLTLTRIPVLLGQGRPLFGPLLQDIPLEHLQTQAYGSGFVQSVYRVLASR